MGPFGYGNLGDAAIVDAAIESIRRRRPECELIGFTLNPRDTEARHSITSFPLSRVTPDSDDGSPPGPVARALARLRRSNRRALRQLERVVSRVPAEFGMLVQSYRALENVDILVMTGSGQLQDYWGGGGPWSYPYTMLRWACLAKLRHSDFVVLSVGAGPVDARLSRLFFRRALGLASYRSYRDEWSRTFVAEQIGFRRDDPIVPDLAFGLSTTAPATRADDSEGERVKIVGVGPIGYFREGNWPVRDDDRWNRYLSTIVELVTELLADGHRVLFLKGESIYDQAVIDDVVRSLRGAGVELDGRIIEAPIDTVQELVDALTRCDVVVASRFHNVLLGYLCSRPVVGLSYQAKTNSLMADFGENAYCVPIGDATTDELVRLTNELLDRSNVGDELASHTNRKRDELDEQYDRVFRTP